MSRLRVAVLGTAHVHLPEHLAVLTGDEETELAGVHDPGSPDGPSVAEILSGADAVLVGATNAERPGLVREALARGLPTLAEKPLAGTAAEVTELAALIGRGPAPVTTAMFLRCVPALRRVRRLIADGALGTLFSAHTRFTHPGLLDGWFTGRTGWLAEPEAGGGFADLGIHLFDLLRWLRPGAGLDVAGVRLRRSGIHHADVGGVALLDWDGIPTTVHSGWISRPGGFLLRLEGSRGSCTVDGGTLTVHKGSKVVSHGAAPAAGAAVSAFLGQVRGRASWDAPTPADLVACAKLLDTVVPA
ncbi:Gfo/Idh/MocA family oxidoreductase [Amycolatopsis sp. NPDC051071]|uniref:Gfo/Idh/MocA family protein n=1 Tax=Amycolatopsis sp. NPDC051071 TaxID=3154637 RepID=UPI0034286764